MGRALVSGILFSPEIRNKQKGWSLHDWSNFPSLGGGGGRVMGILSKGYMD